MTKILVTGGAGFIGSHVVDCLISFGHQVIVLDNLSTGRKEFLNPKAKFYNAEILKDANEIIKIEKPEIVIHMAAQVMLRKSITDPIYDATLNIIGTINVLEACKNNGVKKIIYTSTGGARVGEPKYLPVDENHPIVPLSPYGVSKHSAEHYVEMYGKVYNLNYLIFCFGNVYGPRDDPKNTRVTSIFISKMLKGESPLIFGDGLQTRDFIYVKDLAEFISSSINKNPEHKLFHLANGVQISVMEIFDILRRLTNFNNKPKHADAIKGEVRDIVLDTTLAKRELSWHPTHTIEQGLKETLEWFRSNSIFN